MRLLCALLMASSPARPAQNRGGFERRQAGEGGEQVADLGYGQRQQVGCQIRRDVSPR
jgi:hypothetical protein